MVVTRWYDKEGHVTKIRIFTVVDNNQKEKHVNLHFKNKSGDELAKGNKVLYLSLQEGSNKVYLKPKYGSALTPEETKIFNTNKRRTAINPDNNYYKLEPAYNDYTTKTYDDMDQKLAEYNAYTQFKIPPPDKPKTLEHTQQDKKIPPPPSPTPNPDNLCFRCFNETTPQTGVHYKSGAQGIANWLNNNPDYDLEISVDGGGHSLIFMDDWVDEYESGQTYEQHTKSQFKLLQQEVKRLGADGSRLKLKLLDAEGSSMKYTPVLKK